MGIVFTLLVEQTGSDGMCQKRVHRFRLESRQCFIKHSSAPHPPPGGLAAPASCVSPWKVLIKLCVEVGPREGLGPAVASEGSRHNH